MKKLTVLAVIRATACRIPLFCQSASRTTPFPFYYTLSSSSIFITVVSLPGARYVLHNSEEISGTSLFYCLWHVLQCAGLHIFANLPQGQLCFSSTTPSVLHQYLSGCCRCLVPGMLNTTMQKFHLEVNCIGCHTCYSMSHSTFSTMCLKDNSVSLLQSLFF